MRRRSGPGEFGWVGGWGGSQPQPLGPLPSHTDALVTSAAVGCDSPQQQYPHPARLCAPAAPQGWGALSGLEPPLYSPAPLLPVLTVPTLALSPLGDRRVALCAPTSALPPTPGTRFPPPPHTRSAHAPAASPLPAARASSLCAPPLILRPLPSPSTASAVNTPPPVPPQTPARTPLHPDTCVCFKHGPCAGGCHTCWGCHPLPARRRRRLTGPGEVLFPSPTLPNPPNPSGFLLLPPQSLQAVPSPGVPPRPPPVRTVWCLFRALATLPLYRVQ